MAATHAYCIGGLLAERFPFFGTCCAPRNELHLLCKQCQRSAEQHDSEAFDAVGILIKHPDVMARIAEYDRKCATSRTVWARMKPPTQEYILGQMNIAMQAVSEFADEQCDPVGASSAAAGPGPGVTLSAASGSSARKRTRSFDLSEVPLNQLVDELNIRLRKDSSTRRGFS